MNGFDFALADATLTALPSGALWWPDQGLLCVSDLHLGKSDRIARREGRLLPPYEVQATLEKLDVDLAQTGARQVICLGDSFDDLAASETLGEAERLWLIRLQAGRRWVWIEGNHDPGPVDLGGTHLAETRIGTLTFRHIAQDPLEDRAEVSGHYHPKFGLPGSPRRAAFVTDGQRLILPAYGTYTGGMDAGGAVLGALLQGRGRAILTGRRCLAVPLPR